MGWRLRFWLLVCLIHGVHTYIHIFGLLFLLLGLFFFSCSLFPAAGNDDVWFWFVGIAIFMGVVFVTNYCRTDTMIGMLGGKGDLNRLAWKEFSLRMRRMRMY